MKKQRKIRVFVVDDSAIVAQKIKEILSEIKRVEVVGEATNAADAICYIDKLCPDAVTLDIRLNGVSGIDVLECIKKDKTPPKVIVLTNYPYPQYRKKCMDAGADYFFDKSSEFGTVIEVLKKLIQESKAKGNKQSMKRKNTTKRNKK